MAIEPCYDCKGEMKKPNPIFSYDYNTDGWVPFYCIECGICNDSSYIPTKTYSISATLSHQFIKGALQIICKTLLNKDYVFKSELYKLLKNKDFFDVYDLARQIVLHCNGRGYSITVDDISTIIYSELDGSAFT